MPTQGFRHRSPGSAVFSEQAWQAIAESLRLSGRELQIVRGVFDDRIESAIAADLGVSPHTIHTHFERLHRKLLVRDRVELVVRVVAEYLVLTISPASGLPPLCANRASNRCPLGGRILVGAETTPMVPQVDVP